MRKSVAVVLSAALLAALAGCSSSGTSTSSDCTPLASSGSATDVISGTGTFNTAPTLSFPTPLNVDTTERSVAVQGNGSVLQQGDMALIQYSLFDGATGQLLGTSGYTTSGSALVGVNEKTGVGVGVQKTLQCARVGDRVIGVVPPNEGFTGGSQVSVVFVADVIQAYPGRATAPASAAPNGFPNVVYGEDGVPGLEIAGGTPPSDFKTATLRQGDGSTVAEGDQVLVQYQAVIWDTRKIYRSTWSQGTAAIVQASSQGTLATGAIPPALVGQKVGSQYIVVVPPAFGFGNAGSSDGTSVVPPNATLIFVVDVLGVLPTG